MSPYQTENVSTKIVSGGEMNGPVFTFQSETTKCLPAFWVILPNTDKNHNAKFEGSFGRFG